MNRFELLLDVLEENGFPDIRSEIREKEEELNMGSTLRGILTAEEVEVVKKTLKEFKVLSPTGWANALWVHAIREDIKNFSEEKVYDYIELCNLSCTFREAGLVDSGIWRKIDEAKDRIEKYS